LQGQIIYCSERDYESEYYCYPPWEDIQGIACVFLYSVRKDIRQFNRVNRPEDNGSLQHIHAGENDASADDHVEQHNNSG